MGAKRKKKAKKKEKHCPIILKWQTKLDAHTMGSDKYNIVFKTTRENG